MTDLNTALAIIGAAATVMAAIASVAYAVIAFLTLLRTPKPKPEEPPYIPTCTTILGASMNRHARDLPGYSSRMKGMGFDRRKDIG
ncbi:hypothetical protein KRR38_23080 [Novosphingobium sp. G106]|uniref:hypothetical protein n=1 Tax=Novosphingobium sp. G106 TaxID=2849500 RepID=UPI001C2DB816|nr:hypothetical protein [Novosphingobium sp. G106]MBV1690479.1 hypothetical protein [Novosphingobium sp. G106]MBV1690484.1 hypothetical protein [Novosphingobium sp. G106]